MSQATKSVTITLEVPEYTRWVTLDYVGIFCWEKEPEYDKPAGMFVARRGGQFDRIVQSNGATIVEIPETE